MKPFSAMYFLKENKKRCILLILMIFLSFGVYLGGLYVTNPMDNWELNIKYYEDIVSINRISTEEEDYNSLLEEAKKDDRVTVLELGTYQGFSWESIMGFDSGQCTFTFRSVEDFKIFCEHLDIECDFDSLKSGSMIMSEKFAKNKGYSIGDKVDKDICDTIYDEFTLDAVTKEDGYTLYFILDDEESSSAVILGNTIKGAELYSYVYKLQSELKDAKSVFIYPGLRGELEVQFESFNIIYIFIVILLSVILAITINAAFVGMYQRREFEFSVYRAIGISKKRIIGKLVKELLLIDIIALLIGTVVVLIGLYLFNNLVLYPVGKYLRYFEPLAIYNMILCNVIIIVPLIVTRCKKMLKADVCEY